MNLPGDGAPRTVTILMPERHTYRAYFAAGDQILSAVIRRDLAANACRSVAHERPSSEIVNKVTHTLTCTHARCFPFP